MSWLFKDPINSDLAQFDPTQSNSKKWPKGLKYQIARNDFFSQKITNKIFMYLLAPFILQNFKKILRVNPELRGCTIFWAQNGPFPQMRFFFRKLVNEPCFFPSRLSTCKKSKSDINLLEKYWQLKNTEISLAESHV